ncbi:MAG: hypothetical protein M3220_17755 [Chloroflexota bacterium]|nr:hypothetical protein [Chloroflexota bacterium]
MQGQRVLIGMFIVIAVLLGSSAPPATTSTPTPQVEESAALRTYIQSVLPKTEAMGQSLQAIGELFQNARLSDNAWRVDVAAQVTRIRQVHQELQAMTPPPEAESVHQQMLDATQDRNDATDYLVRGLDTLNADDLNEAARLMQQCSEKARQVEWPSP